MAIIHRFVEAPGLGGREAGFGIVDKDLSAEAGLLRDERCARRQPASCEPLSR